MKTILLALGAAGALSGCVGYGGGYSSGYYGNPSYGYPGYIGGSVYSAPAYRHDGGISPRYDRDRDHDGVPNRFDDRPSNPRRH